MVNLIAIGKGLVNDVGKFLLGSGDRKAEVIKASVPPLVKAMTPSTGSQALGAVMPISGGVSAGANIVKTGGGVIRAIRNATKTAITKVTTNPFKGMSPLKAIGSLGAGTLATLGSIKAFKVAKAVGSGQPLPSMVPSGREIADAGAFAYNLPISIAGTVAGLGQRAIQEGIIDQYKNLKNSFQLNFTPPGFDGVTDYFKDKIEQVPSFNFPDIQLPDMAPINIQLPGNSMVMPSMNVSAGGGGGMDLALLALLLGGGGGYLLGRRRKKKYKKRRKH